MKSLLKNRLVHIFLGVVIIVFLIFVGIFILLNYSNNQQALAQEASAYKRFKETQIENDTSKIRSVVLEQKKDDYSNFNKSVEDYGDIIESIEGGYCVEDGGKFRTSMCSEYGNDSLQCMRITKCNREKYTSSFMHKLIETHAMISDNKTTVAKAIQIYDDHPNWDIYSVILAAQGSINYRMNKDSALFVWDNPDKEKSIKEEDDFDVMWFWRKDCSNNESNCSGSDVKGYKRDVLAFNNSGTLFYYLIDR